MNIRTRLFIAALLMISMAGLAYPQSREILQLQKDMIDVTLRVNQLQTTVDRDNAVLKGLIERMADQMNTVTAGMQKLSQTLDGVRTQDDATIRELRAALKTLNDTVKEVQTDLSSARNQINSISRDLTALKASPEPLAGPDDLWRQANVDYSVGLWSLAITGLQEFLSKYPEDPRAAEAQLRIGDALFNEKRYDEAILQYDIVLQKYPEGDTTRAALLKKGLAQAESNQPQATSTLNEVIKRFKGTTEAVNAQTKLKELQSARKTPGR